MERETKSERRKPEMYFSETAQIFKKAVKTWSSRGRKTSMQTIANAYGEWAKRKGKDDGVISRSTAFNYISGYRRPTSDFIDFFTEKTHRHDPEQQTRLKREILESLDRSGEESATDQQFTSKIRANGTGILDRLRKDEPLRVATADYQPIAGSPTERDPKVFFENVFGRVFALAQIPVEPRGPRAGLHPEGYTSDIDLHYGIFNSPDRILKYGLTFFRVPIRMGLGCVFWVNDSDAEGPETAKTLGRMLTELDAKYDSPLKIRPIVVKNDIGAMYCRQVLKYQEDSIDEEERLSVDRLAEMLDEKKNSVVSSVVCTDEFTAIEIYKKQKQNSRLVFPLNSRRTSGEEIRKKLPQYFCSIAIPRSDVPFRDFLNDVLKQVLSTEIESTSKDLFHLAKALAGKVADGVRAIRKDGTSQSELDLDELSAQLLAWEWVFNTLCLDAGSIESFASPGDLPWKPILLRTREMVYEHLVATKFFDSAIVALDKGEDLFSRQTGSGKSEGRRALLTKFCKALEIEIKPEDFTIPARDLANQLRIKLKISPIIRVTIDVQDPHSEQSESEPAKRAVRGFLRLLQNDYDVLSESNKAANDAVKAIASIIESLSNFGGEDPWKGGGRVLAAKLLSSERDYVGGACLLGLSNGNKCELRYLWVSRRSRGRGIGKSIIEKAIEVAREFKCVEIFAEILDEYLLIPATILEEMRFQKDREKTPNGRSVFRLQLPPLL